MGFATMLSEWGGDVTPTLFSDSSSALRVLKKRGPGRMKHIEIRFLALQQWREQKRLTFAKVDTKENCADVLTKPMTKGQIVKFSLEVGLRGGCYRG